MLSCRLRYVAVSWPWCVPLCTCCFLAHGCPTRTKHWFVGTWLPNSTIWHLVAQLYGLAHGCPMHMGAYHVFRSTRLYISFDLHQPASYWLWYYATSIIIRRLHVMYYGHSLLRLHDLTELCTYAFTNIVIIWTSVYWHTCTFRLLHVPCLWRYSIINHVLVDDLRCFQSFLVV